MLADSYSSLRMYLNERIASPLLGSLAISWCIWNYKFILLIFSSLKYQDKLRMISILYSDHYDLYVTGLLFPLLTSLFYLFIFPYPSKFVYSHSLSHQKRLNEIKQEKENQQLLSLERSLEIRAEVEALKRDHASSIEDLIEKVKSHEHRIMTLTEENSSLIEEKNELVREVDRLNELVEKSNNNTAKPSEGQSLTDQNDYHKAIRLVLRMFFENDNKELPQQHLAEQIREPLSIKEFIAKRYIDRMNNDGYLSEVFGRTHKTFVLTPYSIDLLEKGLE